MTKYMVIPSQTPDASAGKRKHEDVDANGELENMVPATMPLSDYVAQVFSPLPGTKIELPGTTLELPLSLDDVDNVIASLAARPQLDTELHALTIKLLNVHRDTLAK